MNKHYIKCKACEKQIKHMPHQIYRKYCSNKCQNQLKSKIQNESNKIKLLEGTLSIRSIIKKTLLYMGMEYKCSVCNIKEWQNKPLTLILDHINGNAGDNHLNNLRFVCPNCDAQSEFYKGKNKGRGRKSLGLL